jgi:hypothetical protein
VKEEAMKRATTFGSQRRLTAYRPGAGCLVGIAGLILLFAAPAANAQGNNGCTAFQATMQGSLFLPPDLPPGTPPAGAWIEEGYVTIRGTSVPLHVRSVYDLATIGSKRETRNIFLGTETGVYAFDDGSTFELASHFTAPHQASAIGLYVINESGTITNGTGQLAGVSGQFTAHGIYGPAVPPIEDGGLFGVIAELHGNICGVDLEP